MTNKEIKKRRYLKSLGRKKMLIVEITKRRHHAIFFIPTIYYFEWRERLKSIFNFEKYEKPEYFWYKGMKMQTKIS